MSAIRFRDVSKVYDLRSGARTVFSSIRSVLGQPDSDTTLYALRDISFEIGRGEAFGIIGRNGAGKSTLLKIIAGITRQTTGSVEVNGLVSSLIELGAGFHPDLTGRENIYMSGALLGISRKKMDEKFNEIVEFAELWKFIDVPVKKYSSGMYARLGFSVAVSIDPEILIVDEILSVGDIFFQQKCFAKMKEIRRTGSTFLFVTHDTSAMQGLCDRAMLLDAGRVDFIGPSSEVVNRYFSKVGQPPLKRSAPQNHQAGAGAIPIDAAGRELLVRHNILNRERVHSAGKSLKIHAVRVTNSSGADTLTVSMLDRLRFDLLIRSKEAVQEPMAGFNLYDRKGNLIFSAGTPQLRVPVPPLEAGQEIVVRFDIAFTVAPGEYTFSLLVSEPSGDGNPNAGYFHEIHEMLGPITVTANATEVYPFYGVAQIPMTISLGTPSATRS